MMGLALTLLTFAIFAALTIVAVTAALKSARVDTIIEDLFSPWPEREPSRPDVR